MDEERAPVVRRAVTELDGHAGLGERAVGLSADRLAAELARRAAEELVERLVIAAHAPEPGRERDLGHREPRLVDELLREEDAAGLRHGHGRRAEVLLEETAKLALPHADPLRELLDVRAVTVERALRDEPERAGHRVGRATPGREVGPGLRPAAQARTEARFLRRRGGREEAAVLEPGRAGRADRTAVDAGRSDAYEDAAVEPLIARLERLVANLGVEHFG